MKITVATWNINSVRLREPIVLKLLEEESPDILCLQECKITCRPHSSRWIPGIGLRIHGRPGAEGIQRRRDTIEATN